MAEKRTKDKEELIREAATKVIAEQGYFQTSAQEIADKAGVSVGTIYNYFGSKEEILLDIFAQEFEDRRKFYRELSRSDLPLFEQIRKILDRHFSQMAEHQELMSVIIQERFKPGSELGRQLNQHYEEVVRYVERLADQAQKDDQIRDCDTGVVASAMFGAVESVVAYGMLQDQSNTERFFDRAPDQLATFFWEGIKKRGD
ncbi:MAG: TetR/AcrR family transcriptional regulator [Candidatus Bipolaricaulota bacterium]